MARGLSGLLRGRRDDAGTGRAEPTAVDRIDGADGVDGDRSGTVGCRIADAPDRVRVRVRGHLRAVTLRPRGGVPALEAELHDGSAGVALIWLGRRRIGGIAPGRELVVEGRIGRADGARVIFNPRYELLP